LRGRLKLASRHALLIGISSYGEGLQALPSALLDVEAMREVLADPELGDIPPDQLQVLTNPDRTTMEKTIETFFANKSADDLLLFYFSGHGMRDKDDHQLLLSTRESQYIFDGGISYHPVATTLPASTVRRYMDNSLSEYQIVILDCCFSGAFAHGMLIGKGIEEAFGGNGRAVLTSSEAVETSRAPASGDNLSVYTRFLVEGIQTGAADIKGKGWVNTKDLHDYALRGVQAIYPTMTPQFFSTLDGYKIKICKVRRDPSVEYRQRLLEYLQRGRGDIVPSAREFLNILQKRLGLDPETAAQIEDEAIQPYLQYHENLKKYQQIIRNLLQERGGCASVTENDWRDLKEAADYYGLPDEDVATIHRGEGLGRALQRRRLPIDKLYMVIKDCIQHNKRALTISLLAATFTASSLYIVTPHIRGIVDILSCRKAIGDQISEGEEILIPDNDILQKLSMVEGSSSSRQCQYTKAYDHYKNAWKSDRTKPEQLIYMNNSMLDSMEKSVKYYTIAVAISVKTSKTNGPKGRDYDNDFAREILRGVAQLQSKVNLGIVHKNNTLIMDLLGNDNTSSKQFKSPGNDNFPIQNGINGLGLKVIIINDSNDEQQAKHVARLISAQDNVLGIVGHYASDMSRETFDIYKSNNLAMVSPGSTSPWFTDNSSSSTNFFRTVFSGRQQSCFIAQFLQDKSIRNIVGFYSEESSFAKLFYESFKEIFRANPFNGKVESIVNQETLGLWQGNELERILKDLRVKGDSIASASNSVSKSQLGIVIFPNPIGNAKKDAIKLVKANGGRNWIIGTWGLRTNETLLALDDQKSLERFVIAVPWDPWTAKNRSFLEPK